MLLAFNPTGPVLLISHDVVGPKMAGPGIRYYQLARVLAREFDVRLAVPTESLPENWAESFQLFSYRRGDWATLEPLAQGARVIIFPSDSATEFLELAHSPIPLVVDGYDPLYAEWLELNQHRPEFEAAWAERLRDLTHQYLVGDFFICASERQRDWWLGLLEANGRLNAHTFREDSSFRALVDVVPYGLPEGLPQHTHNVIKGVWPGIHAQDRLLLWGGGLWPWFDPQTAVRAVARLRERRPEVKLIFPGTRHPNPILDGIPTHTEATRALAKELGQLDSGVFFGDWLPYADWPGALMESAVALTLHGTETAEARLAFRSRVLEYIWAGLPVVATQGDVTSDLIANYQLGQIVPNGDEVAVAEAIQQLLDLPPQALAENFQHARQHLTWERAAQPLLEFCRHPRHAPDKIKLGEQIGLPYYQLELARWRKLAEERDATARWYEQHGLLTRVMKWVEAARAGRDRLMKLGTSPQR